MTERKKFPLAARRAMPLATVLPPVAVALDDAQSVVATELQRMREHQGNGLMLTADQSKSLSALVTALVHAEKAKRELESEGLDGLTEDELDEQVLRRAEEIRAKRGEKP